jgi:hypothetical protein
VGRRGRQAVIAFSAVGFAIGAYWPSRFAAAVSAFIGFLALVVVAVTTFGPFGEQERSAGRWLPWLRLGTAVALTTVAFGTLAVGAAAGGMPAGPSPCSATSAAWPASAC